MREAPPTPTNDIPCQYRAGITCTLITAKLGFAVGISRSICEKCISEGPEHTNSVKLREHHVDLVLQQINVDPKLAQKVKGVRGWSDTRVTWKNATEWAKSKGSALFRTITLEQLEVRRTSCFGADPTKACPMLRKFNDGYHYCGACGCGVREEARLDGAPSKLEYPHLECPLRKRGFSNEDPEADSVPQSPPRPT